MCTFPCMDLHPSSSDLCNLPPSPPTSFDQMAGVQLVFQPGIRGKLKRRLRHKQSEIDCTTVEQWVCTLSLEWAPASFLPFKFGDLCVAQHSMHQCARIDFVSYPAKIREDVKAFFWRKKNNSIIKDLFIRWVGSSTNVEIWVQVDLPLLFARYSFSLCVGRLSQLWLPSSYVSHRWPVIHSVSNSPEIQNSSESFIKRVPLSHPGSVRLSGCHRCLLFSPLMADVQTNPRQLSDTCKHTRAQNLRACEAAWH